MSYLVAVHDPRDEDDMVFPPQEDKLKAEKLYEDLTVLYSQKPWVEVYCTFVTRSSKRRK